MATFLDGPAAGVHLILHRAPIMLRVVGTRGGKWDALDQPDDKPELSEQVYLYQQIGVPFRFHLSCRGKGKSASGWYQDGYYLHLPTPPADEYLRDNALWAQWCDLNKDELLHAPWKWDAARAALARLQHEAKESGNATIQQTTAARALEEFLATAAPAEGGAH